MIRIIKFNFTTLRTLILFATVMSILTVASATATMTLADTLQQGESPTSSSPLDSEVNQGTLEPGEQHWFTFSINNSNQTADIEKSLRLVITPNQGNTIRFIILNVFEENEIPRFSAGSAEQMTPFGTGQVITQDNNPDTGERFWQGSVVSSEVYYIQLLNDSDFTVDYWLYNEDINITIPDVPDGAEEDIADEEAPDITLPQLGDSDNPAPLLSGLNRGTVPPNSVYWYTFKHVDFSGNQRFKPLDFTMFATPDNGHRRHRVNFELFPAKDYEKWQLGELDELTNFGAGMQVSRDGDYNTAERIWRGVVQMNDTYMMAIKNGNDVEMDYWLYNDEDIYNPLLGPVPESPAALVFAEKAAPQTAAPLKLGLNKDSLGPGEEAWYSFSITDFDKEKGLREMALTMITTPDDGNRIRRMTFDVFTAGGVRDWSPGDNTQINNMGAGSVVYRDKNPLTGERFWQGWVVDNDLYLVQVRNGTEVDMDYWLYTGDVYSPELGEKTVPKRLTAAPGTAPFAPIELEVGTNDGQLKPNEERWYAFSRQDVEKGSRVETIFTMIFTPDDGNRRRDVNIEFFEARELRDWAPDNRFNINNFGQGSVVSRDGDVKTGEYVWKGHLLGGDLYYMRVSNESDVTIDFKIFPDDVISTTLVQ